MAAIVREVLNATGMSLSIFSGGMSKVGINLSGTWTGTVAFSASATDSPLNFFPISVTPFASGTAVPSATANGNFEVPVKNYAAVRVTFTQTTGAVAVSLGASIDSSYQDAFLASTSRFVEQDSSGGLSNVITVAAQVNRAWRLRTLSGGFSVAPAAAVKVTVSDGASSVLWAEYVAAAAGGWKLNLPTDPGGAGLTGGGVVNTPGNSLVITLAAPAGAVASSMSAEIAAA